MSIMRYERAPRVVLLCALLSGFAACGGDGSGPTNPGTPAVASVRVSPDSAVVEVGATRSFSAQALSANGAVISGLSVQWTSDAAAVATVSANGVVTAKQAGTAGITATVKGIVGSASVRVPEPTPVTLAISFARDTLILDRWGDTASTAVSVRDQNGTLLDDATVAWQSLDPAVADVSSGGVVESVAAGTAVVRVTASRTGSDDVQGDITVLVVAQQNAMCAAPSPLARGGATGAITFGPAQILTSITTPTHDGSRSLAGDYDGDGDTDIVRLEYSYPSSDPYTGTVLVFRNDGGTLVDATASVLQGAIVPDHPRDFEIADFTGDGVVDFYVAQHGYDAEPFPGAPNLFLTRSGALLGDAFATSFSPASTSGFSHGSTAADVDCDGDLDLVELNLLSGTPNHLFINDGSGHFSAAPSEAFPISGDHSTQRWQEAEFIDFDSDGDPDLYLGARSGTGWNEDVLLVNDGFGNFRETAAVQLPAPVFSPEHGVNNAKAADFDGDGLDDLLLFEIPQPFSTSSAIRLWLNDGDGTFTDASAAWGLPSQCTAEMIEPLYVRDMNRDGWPDVIIPASCPNLGMAGLLMNTGSGFQHVAFSTIEPWLEWDVATPADINGDGELDLFFGERGGNPVLVDIQ